MAVTAKEIYTEIAQHKDMFGRHGFQKKGSGTYVNPRNIEIKFQCDKWGWTMDVGTGFVIRVRDLNKKDEWGNVPPSDILDINLPYMLSRGYIKEEWLRAYLGRFPDAARTKLETGYWLPVYKSNDTDDLLKHSLGPLLSDIDRWSMEHTKINTRP